MPSGTARRSTPARLQALTVRANGRAARDVVLWLGLLVGSGGWPGSPPGSWWAVPAFFVYGALYGVGRPTRAGTSAVTARRSGRAGPTTPSTTSPRSCSCASRRCGAGRTSATTPTRSSSGAIRRSCSPARSGAHVAVPNALNLVNGPKDAVAHGPPRRRFDRRRGPGLRARRGAAPRRVGGAGVRRHPRRRRRLVDRRAARSCRCCSSACPRSTGRG